MPESNPPPALPEVYDEAGDSPRWVPVLGAGLFIVLAVALFARVMTQPSPQPTAAPHDDEQPAEQAKELAQPRG